MHFRKSKNSVAGVWMSVLENTALCLPWFVSILMSELRYETVVFRTADITVCMYILGLWGPLMLEHLFFKRVWEIYVWANTDVFREQNYFSSYLLYEVKTSRWALTSETVQVLSIAAREAIDLVFREQGISLPAVTHSSEKQPWLYGENADFPVFKWRKS